MSLGLSSLADKNVTLVESVPVARILALPAGGPFRGHPECNCSVRLNPKRRLSISLDSSANLQISTSDYPDPKKGRGKKPTKQTCHASP